MSGVQVTAKRRGFYGQLREAGETFTVADEKQVGSWMEPVEPQKPAKPEPQKPAK